MSKGNWRRVSKSRPCPVCRKPDWCLYIGPDDAPTAAICARMESNKKCGAAGWLHRLRDSLAALPRYKRTVLPAVRLVGNQSGPDLCAAADRWHERMLPPTLDLLAHELGVSAESLCRLRVGWSASHDAWTFPMHDAAGNVVGVRLRRRDGSKLSVWGGHEGLFIPIDLPQGGRLLICEGPTDTAALLDLGFSVVGRPSCSGGVRHVVDLVRRLAVPEVVIVADGDAPGQRGAGNLAATLAAYCPAVRIIAPPAGVKDAREWKRRGATAADVERAIDAAPVRKLTVRAMRKAGRHG
jgi:hypothetical protein